MSGPVTLMLPSALRDLRKVRAANGLGINASANQLYAAAFGRDSITVALDLLQVPPGERDIARDVILTCARLQGVRTSPPGPHCNEEEPGKIHHEHRSVYEDYRDGRRVSGVAYDIFAMLSERWGGDGETVTGYTSVDATPLWILLVERFCRIYGAEILDSEVTDRCGSGVTIRNAVLRALEWLEGRLMRSDLGLLEFRSRHPEVLTKFQTWKDSASFIHVATSGARGELANWDAPIASVEVQGLAHDALVAAADLFSEDLPSDARRWRRRARTLQASAIEALWMEDLEYFAMGIDRWPGTGGTRLIATVSSSAASLLNTGLLFHTQRNADRAEGRRQQYVSGVVRRVWDPEELLAPTGIRCRSLRHGELANHADYHGHWTSWIKDSWDCAQGLRRHGLDRLADDMENRILAAGAISGHLEFHFVAPDGRVAYQPIEASDPDPMTGRILGTLLPEPEQAWTISAILAIKRRRGRTTRRPTGAQPQWCRELEDQCLARSPAIGPLATIAALARYAERTQGRFWIDRDIGRTLDVEARLHHDANLRLLNGPRDFENEHLRMLLEELTTLRTEKSA